MNIQQESCGAYTIFTEINHLLCTIQSPIVKNLH